MPEPRFGASSADETIPRGMVVAVLLLTPVPFLIVLLGFSFNPGGSARLIHSLLEWTCVCLSVFTFGLAILAWKARPDPLVFVIALAALMMGLSDTLHTLTTSGLLGLNESSEDFVEWSGAMGRLVRTLVLAAGAAYALAAGAGGRRLAILTTFAGSVAFALMWSSVPENSLLQPLTHEVRKPWDLPVLLLVLTSAMILGLLVRRAPSLLAKALLLTTIPEGAVGLHMAFGSAALYDAHFFNAHALKVLVAMVPLSAVCLHLVRSYRREVAAVESMQKLVRSLEAAESELRAKEDRLSQLTQSIKEVFWIVNRDGSAVHYVSPAYQEIFGRSAESLYRDARTFLEAIHPDDRPMWEELLRKQLDIWEHSYRIVRPDGEVRWLRSRGFAIHDGGEVPRLAGVTEDMTDRKEAEEEQARLQRELLEISNREQERLGHDLHDGIAQQLMGIALLCEVLHKRLDRGSRPEAEQARQIEKLVEDALVQTRSLARGLAPVEIDEEGLSVALQNLARTMERIHGVRCRFRCEPRGPIASREEALHLYRIAQEAVSNALRHGRPTRIAIEISSAQGRRRLTILDDGIGIGPALDTTRSREKAEGMGLHIMRYRARMIGALFDIRPAAGQGTLVSCEWSSAREAVEPLVQES
jgi:PAS domain S-box-containing protein